MIGKTLNHFKILDRLGKGGMGEVYVAEDGKLKRRVALKVLSEEVARDPARLEYWNEIGQLRLWLPAQNEFVRPDYLPGVPAKP